MGCTASMVTVSRASFRQKDLSTVDQHCDSFSITIKSEIRRTWKILSSDIVANGVKVLLKLFSLSPAIKKEFIYTNDKELEVFKEHMFKLHASRLMQVVDAVVENIDDLHIMIDPMLYELGKQHYSCEGFQHIYWDSCSEAILFVWQQVLLENFSPDVSKAWTKVLAYIVTKLKTGYQQAIKEEPSETIS